MELRKFIANEEGEDDSMIQCDICGEYYEHEEEGEEDE